MYCIILGKKRPLENVMHNKLNLMKYSDNKDSENTSEKLDFLEFLRKSPLK